MPNHALPFPPSAWKLSGFNGIAEIRNMEVCSLKHSSSHEWEKCALAFRHFSLTCFKVLANHCQVRTLHLQHTLIWHCLIPGKCWGLYSEKPGSVRDWSTSISPLAGYPTMADTKEFMDVCWDDCWCGSSITMPFAAWRQEGSKGKGEQ